MQRGGDRASNWAAEFACWRVTVERKGENAIQRIQGQIRARKFDMESRSNISLTSQHAICLWLIEHAAQCLHMCQTGRGDGFYPVSENQGTGGHDEDREILEKKCSTNHVKTVKMDKTEARWKYGLWLGLIEHVRTHQ